MVKDEPAGKKINLPEQRPLDRTQEKKKSLCTLQERPSNSGGLQGCREVMQEEN